MSLYACADCTIFRIGAFDNQLVAQAATACPAKMHMDTSNSKIKMKSFHLLSFLKIKNELFISGNITSGI